MTWLGWASAVATTATALAWRPPPRWLVATRLGPATERGARPAGLRPLSGRVRGPLVPGLVVLATVVVTLATSGLATVIVVTTAVAAGSFAARQVLLSRRRAQADRWRTQTGAALDLLAAELRAGVLPQHALAAIAVDVPLLRPAGVAAARAGDVPETLRASARTPGAEGLAELAAAWQVAERAGAPLAVVLDRLAATVRDDSDLEREIGAEASPARATGRLMAVLPVLGLALGAGMGADPVHVLTRTTPGSLCLAAGVALACVGVAWVDRIVGSAEAE